MMLLTSEVVAAITADPKKRLTIFDSDTRGLCVRVTPTGAKSYTIVARDPTGKQVWAAVGDYDAMTLEQARTKAQEGVARIKAGLEPFPGDMTPIVLKHIARPTERSSRNYNLRNAYGIDQQHYEQILRAQNGGCKICGTRNPGGKNGWFCVDHCHATNRIRGLLCNRCNVGLGNFLDDPDLLDSARRYLRMAGVIITSLPHGKGTRNGRPTLRM